MAAVLAILCITSLLLVLGGVSLLKLYGQQKLDDERRYYRVTFPADLTAEEVGEWLLSISGALRPKYWGLLGQQAIVFEVHGTAEGLTHSMRVPWRDAEFIIAQMRAKLPYVYAERVTPPRHPYWIAVAEYGETHPEHTLNIPNPTALTERLLNAMNNLEEPQELLMQWVVTAAPINRKPEHGDSRDRLHDQRDQLNELNLAATLRIGATAKTGPAAKYRLHQLETALASTRTPHNHFRKRFVIRADLDRRIERGSGAFTTTSKLKVNELAGLIGWANNAAIAGMPRGRARVHSAPNSVLEKGIVLGKNPVSGRERPVALGYTEALMHTWIGGRTGTGKTALMGSIGRQIMHDGHGLIVMESEGDLYETILNYVPPERINDVVLVDFADVAHVVGLNILDQGSTDVAIDNLIKLFDHKYGNGLWSDEYIYNGFRTLAESNQTLALTDVMPLVAPRTPEEAAWADDLVRGIKDVELKRWWQSHDNRGKQQQSQRTDPLVSRVGQLVARPELRYVFGQRTSSFRLSDVLAENKILLINLKGVASGTTGMVGTLIMDAIWHAAKTANSERPTYLMLDEFADYMDLPVGFDTMLAQARKRNLGMVLANQHLSQLTQPVRDGILSNARSKIVFSSRDDDARAVLKEMGSTLNPTDITNLQKFEALADLVTPTGTSGPITIHTNAPAKPTYAAKRVTQISRDKYTRSAQEVRDELLHRFDTDKQDRPARQRPTLSGTDW